VFRKYVSKIVRKWRCCRQQYNLWVETEYPVDAGRILTRESNQLVRLAWKSRFMFEINEHQGQLVMEIVKYCTRSINSGMSRCHWVNISPAFPQGSLGRQDCLTLKMILRNPGNYLRYEHRPTSHKTAVTLCEPQSGKTCKSHLGYTYVITISSVTTSEYSKRPVFAEVCYYGVTVIWKLIISRIINHALRE